MNPNNSTSKSNDPRSRACRAVDASARAYLQRGGTDETFTRLVEKHLQQLDAKCQRHGSALDGSTLNAENLLSVRFQCLKIAFQLELGIVEVLIEQALMSKTATAETYANVSTVAFQKNLQLNVTRLSMLGSTADIQRFEHTSANELYYKNTYYFETSSNTRASGFGGGRIHH